LRFSAANCRLKAGSLVAGVRGGAGSKGDTDAVGESRGILILARLRRQPSFRSGPIRVGEPRLGPVAVLVIKVPLVTLASLFVALWKVRLFAVQPGTRMPPYDDWVAGRNNTP
jgi:hypothetical protein